jgi:uncharacterized membrane protein
MTLAAFARPEQRPRPPRIDGVDVARGIALLAMFVYHFAWDLSYFRLIRTDVAADPAWRWFAHVIAGSFLALVGASLVLAARGGIARGAFLRRLALVAGAATLVTVGTYFFLPYAYVFFGILHHIAVASVLGLAFLRLPLAVTALAAAIAFALPFLVAYPALDQSWLLWTGLSRLPVNSGDFVPLLPWFGCVLAGMVLARLALAGIGEERLSAFRAEAQPWRLLSAMGRHSLPIYLVHQPLFIALLSVFLWFRPAAVITTPASDAEARPFVETCVTTCIGNGQEADICRDACQCTADGLRRDGLWRQALSGQMSTTERTRVGEIARLCTRGE